MVGAGGQEHFVLKALCPGESIVCFYYSRSWEVTDEDEEIIMLVTVDDAGNIFIEDVTDTGVLEGIVTAVNEEDYNVTIRTGDQNELIVQIAENDALPVLNEHILVYTNGSMAYSAPATVDAIAWAVVPQEDARE